MVDYVDRFPYIEPSLHPWNEAYFFTVNDILDMFLVSVCKNFIEYFSWMLVRDVGLKFSFFVGSLCDLDMSVIVASKN